MSPTVCVRFILHTILLIAESARVRFALECHTPSPISQTELDTGRRLTLIHLESRRNPLGLTYTIPFFEPSRHWLIVSNGWGNGGSKSIPRSRKCLRWTGSLGNIVFVGATSNPQFDGLSHLDVQNLGRGPTVENCEYGTGDEEVGCTLN